MDDTLLNIIIKAQDLASKQVANIKSEISRLDSAASNAANDGLSRLKNGFDKTVNAAKIGVSIIGGLALAVGGLATGAAMSNETMQIALKSAFQGNAELAAEAGKNIKEFAKKTPYETAEVMDAFIKLKNLGLDPSNAALEAYGNTASGMGKDLNQMIEAVADASVGEFERLKEFGIRASKQGDQVAFTFQGVTTNIKNNAGEIEAYLQNIGNVNFAGGMEAQSQTLSGILSTMKDNVTFALTDILEGSGLYERIKNFIVLLNDEIEKIDFKKVGEELGKFFDKVNELLPVLERLLPLIAGIAGAFAAYSIITSVAGFLSALAIAFTAAGGGAGILALSLAFLTSPIFLIAVAIGTLIAVGILLVQNWGFIMEQANRFKNFLGIVFVYLGYQFNTFAENAKKTGNSILNFFTSIPNQIQNAFKSVANIFIDDINRNIGNINGFIQTIKSITGQSWIPTLWTIPRFEQGGIVGGNSYHGDKILARVNSGELILNQQQQAKLDSQLDSKSSGNNINVNIEMNAPVMFNDQNKKEFVKSIAYQLKLIMN
jgi:hypothetical protein